MSRMISFRWIPYAVLILMCYLPICFATSDSTIVPTSNGVPSNVIEIAAGYLDWPPTMGEQNSFVVMKTCPPNFTPYIDLRSSKLRFNSQGIDTPQGFGACVNALNSISGGYIIGYLTSRYFINTLSTNSTGWYVGTNPGAWTAFSTRSIPMFYSWINGYTADYHQVGGMYWSLRCYPPSIGPPMIQSGNVPFNNGCRGGVFPY